MNQALFQLSLNGIVPEINGPILRDNEVDWVLNTSVSSLLRDIQQKLREWDSQAKTAVLIYDYEIFPGDYSVCTWAINANGILASEKYNVSREIECDRPISVLIREKLGVEANTTAPLTMPLLDSKRCALYNAKVPDPEHLLYAISSFAIPNQLKSAIVAGDIDRIAILPVVDLGNVPFNALPIDRLNLVVDKVSVVILPDLNALFLPAKTTSVQKRQPLVIGDPNILPPRKLPGAKVEAEYVASKITAQLLTQGDATIQNVKAQLVDRENALIYFAAHALSHPGEPLAKSRILLADGDLTGADIAKLNVAGSTVVMSACQTALGKVYGGGVLGLARAWYHAGAKQIVMSLWDLEDVRTQHLMIAFIDHMTDQKLDVEGSLQRAVSDARSNYGWRNSYGSWSGLAVFGIPSPR